MPSENAYRIETEKLTTNRLQLVEQVKSLDQLLEIIMKELFNSKSSILLVRRLCLVFAIVYIQGAAHSPH